MSRGKNRNVRNNVRNNESVNNAECMAIGEERKTGMFDRVRDWWGGKSLGEKILDVALVVAGGFGIYKGVSAVTDHFSSDDDEDEEDDIDFE